MCAADIDRDERVGLAVRILFWSEGFWPNIGGAEVLGSGLLTALRARGYELIVVTMYRGADRPDTNQHKEIPVHRFPFATAFAGQNVDQMTEVRQGVASLKRNFAPSLVHLQMAPLSPSAIFHLLTANIHPSPLLLTLHGTLPNVAAGHETLLGQILRSATYVTANSEAVLAEARRLVPEITTCSRLIYNALPVPSLSPEPLPNGPPRLLCLGRLIHDKGFDLALSALAALAARHPRVEMVVAGDGPARPDLERQAAGLGLAGRVTFVGWVTPEQVPALLNTATVVVMPSRREGFGLVALEAALMARPVVATRVGGLPEVVLHEQTGLLVARDDSHGLAEAIASLLAHPHVGARLGQSARQHALAVFNWERCVDAYDTLYRTLITEGADAHVAKSPASQWG